MTRHALFLAALLALAACGSGSNPVTGGDDTNGGGTLGGGTTGALSNTSVVTLTGPESTKNPTAGGSIHRQEVEADNGDGYAKDFKYDPKTDTFSVDNLGFDGNNAYTRATAKQNLGPFQVYESKAFYADDVTGAPIGQFVHRALYGVSASGKTRFAIVRTGSYAPYGFGGFMYERDGKVVLPATGQANYDGKYAALRDFNGAGGLEYATGDMNVAIDLRDFNNGNAIQGHVTNRVIYDINGKDITASVLAALNSKNNASLTELPVIVFTVGPGVMDKNGEIEGSVTTPYPNNDGQLLQNGTGKYYGVLSGDNEVVGVIVTEAPDPRRDGVTVRETGGFILYRTAP